MRTLILGATGHVGSQLLSLCRKHDLPHFGTSRKPSPHATNLRKLDLRDAAGVDRLITLYRPDVTFLAAGHARTHNATNADLHAVHAQGARRVAEAVAGVGGRLVSFHPDDVVGDSNRAASESAAVNPQGAWAEAHAEGEAAIRENLPGEHLIVRTGWLFGGVSRARTLAASALDSLGRNTPHAADPARWGHPTYAPDLAEVAFDLARLGETGTLHLVGPDRQTESSFAKLVAHVFGYDADLVAERATGPARSVWLDRTRMRTLVGAKAIRTTADGLRAMRNALRAAA